MTKIVVGIVTWLFRIPSWEISDRIGSLLGRVLCVLGVRKKVVMENLNFVFASESTPPERRKGPKEIRRICRGCYENFGRVIVNYLRWDLINKAYFEKYCTAENQEVLDHVLARGKGAVILGAHLGGWELSMMMGASLGYRVHLIAKTMPNPYIQEMAVRYRRANGVSNIPPKNSRDRVLAVLADNGVVALVFDQNMPGRRGVFVDFFGKAASTVKSTAGIVRDSGAGVIGAHIRRVAPARYKLTFYPEIPWIPHEDPDQERFLNTQRYARFIEESVLERPEDWFWLHRRWKRRPPEESARTGKPPLSPQG